MGEIFSIALLGGLVLAIVLLVLLLLRGRGDAEGRRLRELEETLARGLERVERELREELSRGRREDAEEAFRDREERAQSANLLGQAVTTQLGQLGALQSERLEGFARELGRFSLGLDERLERLKLAVEGRLTAIQADNAAKLEEMRRTVDEKLHATLEQRLGESFKLVSERLEQVHRGLGEMQTLAAGVGDLKRVLGNVKTRGTWGEVQLAALLEQLLTADQFSANVATRPSSAERVDFAIALPGKDDGATVWLPIGASTGGWLPDSPTVMVTTSVSESAPSVALNTIEYSPLWTKLGVHENDPVPSPAVYVPNLDAIPVALRGRLTPYRWAGSPVWRAATSNAEDAASPLPLR